MISYQNSVLFAGKSLNNTHWRERYGQMAPKTAEEALDQLIKLPKEVVAPQISDEQLIGYLKEKFVWVEAAGGAVCNSQSECLLIYRNGRWDLPKGKIEPNETVETAALREVAEETGLQRHKIEYHICDTYHIYNAYGPWTAKCTHWFAMSTDESTPTKPQTEEGITRAEWFPYRKIHSMMDQTYPSIRTVFSRMQFHFIQQTLTAQPDNMPDQGIAPLGQPTDNL